MVRGGLRGGAYGVNKGGKWGGIGSGWVTSGGSIVNGDIGYFSAVKVRKEFVEV